MKIKTAILFSILSFCLAPHLQAATVIWDCFVTSDVSDLLQTPATSIHYYDGNISPEIIFTHTINSSGKISSVTSTGEGCNLGWPIAYWVVASYGDILASPDDFLTKDILYNFGHPDILSYTSGTTLSSNNADSYYFAILGSQPTGDDWYGWVEAEITSSGISVVSSAISYDAPLIVGSGTVPEPTSASLILIGTTMLFLRRKK